jgi:hypothetical protein
MRTDTVIAATLIVTTASNAAVQVPTCPVQISVERENVAASMWAEKLFAAARPASNDAARFAANLLADFS